MLCCRPSFGLKRGMWLTTVCQSHKANMNLFNVAAGEQESYGDLRVAFCALTKLALAVPQFHLAFIRLLFPPSHLSVTVKYTYRLRVPELTRQETFSQLSHYAATGRFMMVPGEC